ncbi:DoxX family protein [Mucilaginibacter sp.]|jgi:putative oxidoreductase|uniref:DoxX family protein n=1 Tax=Mucilaginibacter sp. TaxID=1882438 RepID=UPI002C8F5AD8|nr:DoxX family protein [Mucilaginibacter sp.]HTI60826.1 DoxX family protein [Mucilaginibacter sp.]
MLKQLLSSEGFYKNLLVIIRAISGIIIAKYGLEVFKANSMQGNFDWLTDLHMPAPHFMAYLGKLTELVGGALLAIGLFTRLVTIPLIINMGVIIFFMGKGNIWGDEQLPFLLLLLFAVFFFTGAGKWSVDHWLFDRKNKS